MVWATVPLGQPLITTPPHCVFVPSMASQVPIFGHHNGTSLLSPSWVILLPEPNALSLAACALLASLTPIHKLIEATGVYVGLEPCVFFFHFRFLN